MKKKFAVILGFGLIVAAPIVTGPALADDEVIRSVEVGPFSRIETQGSFSLYVEVGGEQSVEVEAEERDQKRITAELDGETLVISYRERFFSFLDRSDRIIRVSVPSLEGVEINGSNKGWITGIEGKKFNFVSNGRSKFELGGTCGRLGIGMNGMGKIDARGLECEDVTVEINGMGDVTVYASQSITARLNGMGDIDVYGNPESVDPRIEGFGEFSIKE